MSGDTLWTVVVVLGLALVTVLTRASFVVPRRDPGLPGWVRRGLRHAPLAALAAVVVPEVVMTGGQITGDWRDPRLWAALAGTLLFFWRRSILVTTLGGLAVLLALRLGLGW